MGWEKEVGGAFSGWTMRGILAPSLPYPRRAWGDGLREGALNPHSLPNASQTGHLSPACHKQNLGICNREGVESREGGEEEREGAGGLHSPFLKICSLPPPTHWYVCVINDSAGITT